jgi:protease stability complex PrcB-like protein
MTPSRYAILTPLTLLAACAGGTTMRVAEGDTTEYGPVALAPEPDTGPDSAVSAPAPAPTVPTPATESPETSGQGYAPYGGSGGGTLELRRIGQWTRTGIREARRLVIRNANTWAEFWSELGVGERPDVDFSRDVVIAVAAGQRPSGGYEIAVDRVTQKDGELTAEVVETIPGPNCMTTASLTQPVDVVVVPAVAARGWSFVERKDVRGCR